MHWLQAGPDEADEAREASEVAAHSRLTEKSQVEAEERQGSIAAIIAAAEEACLNSLSPARADENLKEFAADEKFKSDENLKEFEAEGGRKF